MPEPDKKGDERRNANIMVLVIAAVIVVVGVFVMHWMLDTLRTQRCLEERRSNCDPSSVRIP